MSEQELTVITDVSHIPDFQTEREEAEFRDTHKLAANLYTPEAKAAADALLPPTHPRPVLPPKSNPISLRLGVDLEGRLRVLDEKKARPTRR